MYPLDWLSAWMAQFSELIRLERRSANQSATSHSLSPVGPEPGVPIATIAHLLRGFLGEPKRVAGLTPWKVIYFNDDTLAEHVLAGLTRTLDAA